MSASARDVVAALWAGRSTVATAESLTGGLLCSNLVAVPGASAIVCGGLVAYTRAAKQSALGVEPGVLDEFGTVAAITAEQMAAGAQRIFGSTYALATTGVAGPGPCEGKPAGTVFIALAAPDGIISRRLTLSGDRGAIREATVNMSLSWLMARLEEENSRLRG